MNKQPDQPRRGLFQRLSLSSYWFVALATLTSLLLSIGVWQWLGSEQKRSIETEFALQAS